MNFSSSLLQEIKEKLFEQKKIRIFVLELDKIHPQINGNKYFKLKYNLEQIKIEKTDTILTFGGAYSNHILACAAAGKINKLKTIGIIRGEELNENSNSILKQATSFGMELKFISREKYRLKESSEFISELKNIHGNFFLIPEGGSNKLAVKGAAEITSYIKTPFDFICCACGTGGTIAGISTSMLPHQKAIGISVIKAKNYFEEKIPVLLSRKKIPENIFINTDFHFGGYGKTSLELKTFSSTFNIKHKIKIDEIYNAKLFYAIYKLAEQDFFEKGKTIVCLNTGGYF